MRFKKFFEAKAFLMTVALALFACGFTACSSDDEENTSKPESPLKNAEGIVTLTSGIGDWDAAYLTKEGYFCIKNEFSTDDAALVENNYSSLAFMPADESEIVNIIAAKDGNIPTQMITKDGTVYFSFPNDTILELLYNDGENMELIGSIDYDKQTLPGVNESDNFKAILSNSAYLLKSEYTKAFSLHAFINAFAEIFESVSSEPYVEDEELIGDIATDSEGNFSFAEDIEEWYKTEVEEKAAYAITLWTGEATFKVGGSSCTLSGTIWCPSNIFNKYGTYGILCDTVAERLFLGEAEYEGTGYQKYGDLSFGVDFRGFKPNTTYYYRAYYKFNSEDHGNLIANYPGEFDAVFYDTKIKSFTTGDNILTVDVAMCIDVTGSMSGIINTVKNNAISFYDTFKNCCEEEGIQLAALNAQVYAFRDKNADYNWLEWSETFSLPEQQEEYNSYVNGLYADGGGDIPESGLEALQKIFEKDDWGVDDGYHRQVVILWTDAPYLIEGDYSDVNLEQLHEQWKNLPSGRRLILFAPDENYYTNGDAWSNLDGWKNVIHETNLTDGFHNFEYILQSIIGELTSKGKTRATNKSEDIFFRPNE